MFNFKNIFLAFWLAVFIALPNVFGSTYLINLLVMFFIYLILAQSWNLLGGIAGQVSLGHSAFFGIGALFTRLVWVNGIPILLALLVGGACSMLLAGIVGIPCLRMKREYFPIGTLALAIIAEITVGNIFPVPGSLPRKYIAEYTLSSRYYLALSIAILSLVVAYYTVKSRTGLALVAIRDDERAAEAMGVRIFRSKVKALMIATFLAGLGGGIFSYHQVSYYITSPFELTWSIVPTLTTFIGGLATVTGPVIGSICLLGLNELFAITLGEAHLIIFGFTFILIVLFIPGGLMTINQLVQAFLKYYFLGRRVAAFPSKRRLDAHFKENTASKGIEP